MKLSTNEIKFLESLEEARLATSHQDIPHVKPVSFVLFKDLIFVATDYDTRTWKNIKENPKAAITIDVYKSGGHKAVCFQGKVEIIEKGEEFDNIYQIFYKKFKWVRDDPWKPGEAPFLKLIPQIKTSWGIN
ncbi:MAG: pyridoxamine 5'-phosphate oxidase family protein [Nitrosopumilaceae archaeon]|uniref:Pyridoxamine 5'-phosphate oxidase family protein n=1 Tax=Candidatus Nitrosomaritimum aestuariumsis TaxID=3342354 RepID=A0AC60W0A3_9ARCH|nr:pyridoxamine 5'-phosphate oxidase family protein [Nitrosopumilaceae archaeon]